MDRSRCVSRRSMFLPLMVGAILFAALVFSPAYEAISAEATPGMSLSLPSSANPSAEEKLFKFSGELKGIGMASWPGSGTFIQPQGDKTFFDGLAEARFKGQLFFAEWGNVEVHDVLGITGGDTRQAVRQSPTAPVYISQGDLPGSPPNDKRQMLNMAWFSGANSEFVSYDRIDRLALTLKKDPVLVSLGRQAVTWGNGIIFNPIDLINPFGPTDVVREYKVGQDMAFAQVAFASYGNLQLLWAPRRNPDTGIVKEDESAFAAKAHFGAGNADFDIIAAKNFGDKIIAVGGNGHIGGAVWRADLLWTTPDFPGQKDYFSGVANLDYSWTWWSKNFYVSVEAFYSGVGKHDYVVALNDPYIQKLINENILFALGKWYADATIRMEVHPLFNAYLTVISNVEDPSYIVQPRISWDFARNMKLTLWGNIAFGDTGTEYGGFYVPPSDLKQKPPNGGFAWISYYF